MEQEKKIKEEQRPAVFAVCGVKNSGKTTLLEKLVTELGKRGYQVAVIKHDGHDFIPDVPGTDSYRMQQAGAAGTAVFSSERVLVYKKRPLVSLDALIGTFSDMDIILVEGGKESALNKFEIIRQEISKEPISNPRGRLGIVTDIPGFFMEEEKIFPLNDADGLIKEIEKRIGK